MVEPTPLAQSFAGQRVLVTGDTGFKGSWLAIWLRELGANVIGLALEPTSRRDNFVACGLAERITHVHGDIRAPEDIAGVLARYEPDVVFHLAAQSIVLDSYDDPRRTFDTNVMGTVNLLDALRSAPSVRACVIVTSDKCYENEESLWGYRETDALGGRDPYSASKGAAEIVTASMRRCFFESEGAAAIATARAGNVIGGGDWAAHRILPDCMRSLQRNDEIVIRNPHAVRPWQHVIDALHGYLRLAERLLVDGRGFAQAWNFGPTERGMVTVGELAAEVVRAWGKGELRLAEGATPARREAHFLHLDIAKARAQLGWAPVLDLSRTVAMTVEGYRAEGSSPEALYRHRVDQIRAFEALARE